MPTSLGGNEGKNINWDKIWSTDQLTGSLLHQCNNGQVFKVSLQLAFLQGKYQNQGENVHLFNHWEIKKDF